MPTPHSSNGRLESRRNGSADFPVCRCMELPGSIRTHRNLEVLEIPSYWKAAKFGALCLGRILALCAILSGPHTALGADAPKAPAASLTPSTEKTNDWKPLFDGKTLQGWKVTDFAGHADVTVDPKFRDGPAMILGMGAIMTGVTWTNEPPQGEYEIALDAMKLDGSDFFSALTFPAGGNYCSLIVGGWGGGVVGISSVDGMDASENETTKFISFEKNRWYHVRVKVTKSKIEAWIDKDKVADLVITDRRITVRAGEIELAEPFGITAYQTKAALRDIRMRSVHP